MITVVFKYEHRIEVTQNALIQEILGIRRVKLPGIAERFSNRSSMPPKNSMFLSFLWKRLLRCLCRIRYALTVRPWNIAGGEIVWEMIFHGRHTNG